MYSYMHTYIIYYMFICYDIFNCVHIMYQYTVLQCMFLLLLLSLQGWMRYIGNVTHIICPFFITRAIKPRACSSNPRLVLKLFTSHQWMCRNVKYMIGRLLTEDVSFGEAEGWIFTTVPTLVHWAMAIHGTPKLGWQSSWNGGSFWSLGAYWWSD